MNKLILSVLLVLGLCFTALSQETLNVDVTKLTQQELLVYQQIKQKQAAAGIDLNRLTPEDADKYGRMAEAFGNAVHKALSAITKNVDEFAQTGAGKITIVLIAWKVMGNDATRLVEKSVQFAVGGFLLLVGIPFWVFMFRRNCIVRPEVVSTEKLGWFRTKVTYGKTFTPPHCDESMILYGLCLAVFIGICSAIMFVG